MIEKLIAIKNVGKFRDYSCTGDVAFKRFNIIYAENGIGKTTLSAILRSLKNGESAPILERRTLGQSSDPEIKVLAGGRQCCFTSNSWDETAPDIEIFDPVFVNENVYAGDTVEFAHKKNLHKFAIGEEAVSLAQSIDALDNTIRDLTSEIKKKDQRMSTYISGNISVRDFVDLELVADVDDKIASKKSDLEAIDKSEQIAAKESLSEIKMPEINFDKYTRLLGETFDALAGEALEKAKTHIKQNLDAGGENWVNTGIGYIKDDLCPFCGTSLKGNELISSYREYFSDKYAELKETIKKAREEIEEILAEEKAAAAINVININRVFSEFWETFITTDYPDIEISAEDIETVWNDVRKKLLEFFELKANSPLEVVKMDSTLRELMADFNEWLKKVKEYNASIGRANSKIEEKKGEVKEANPEIVLSDLYLFENSKKRFTDEGSGLCRDYKRLKKQKDSLNQDKTAKRKELKSTTEEILKKYQEAINRHLARFGADFKIIETKEQHVSGKPSLNYRISINDVPVDLENDTELEPKPCFRNTLSSGDKTSLAFAFFLSRLDLDDGLAHKVIVFDDPISSLDVFRKTYTQQQLLRISGRAEQVIIMSHDPYFLRLVWESANKSDTKTLCITRAGISSILKEWDVERETQGEYFRNYFALLEYLERGPEGDLRAVARCIRPLLEGNLRISFPRRFGAHVNLGGMIGEIRGATGNDPLTCLKPYEEEIAQINDYSKDFHHGDNPDAYSHPITDVELKPHIERTLTLLGTVLTAKESN